MFTALAVHKQDLRCNPTKKESHCVRSRDFDGQENKGKSLTSNPALRDGERKKKTGLLFYTLLFTIGVADLKIFFFKSSHTFMLTFYFKLI